MWALTENSRFHHQNFNCPNPKDDEPDESNVPNMPIFHILDCVYRTGSGRTIVKVEVAGRVYNGRCNTRHGRSAGQEAYTSVFST
jgi:hypothetical protein